MSAYPPPAENLSIFDNSLFSNTTLTKEEADRLYLKYPIGQGEETIPSLNVLGAKDTTGNATFGDNIIMTGTPAVNYHEFPDGSKQYTAYTGVATNTNNVLTNGATAAGTYPISYLPAGTTSGTYNPNYFDNDLTYNPSTNALSVGNATNGQVNINGTGSSIEIAGTGTAITASSANAVSIPAATLTTATLTASTLNKSTGVNLQYNGSTKLSTTNTGIDCPVINAPTTLELKYGGTTQLSMNSSGININAGLSNPLPLNYTTSGFGVKGESFFQLNLTAMTRNTLANIFSTTLGTGVWLLFAVVSKQIAPSSGNPIDFTCTIGLSLSSATLPDYWSSSYDYYANPSAAYSNVFMRTPVVYLKLSTSTTIYFNGYWTAAHTPLITSWNNYIQGVRIA
jgi:hypothetical protein